MYKFKVIKSPEAARAEFESALSCAKCSIESVLDNEFLVVDLNGDSIVIRSVDNDKPIGITLSQCKAAIKDCFLDSTGTLYPEFSKVIPE